MYPILFQIGHFEVRSYGLIVALAFVAALWLSVKEARWTGVDPRFIQDFAVYALVGGIIGARVYFVVFSDPGYFLRNPLQILAVWRGGIGVIGALIGGVVAGLWYAHRKRISFWRLADTAAPGMALAQTLGQLACLANGDSYGRPTDLPWAIVYTDPRSFAPLNTPLHPIELYEMAAYLLVFLLVWATRRRFTVNGFTFLTYLAAYAIARFSMEFFRGDPAMFAAGVPAAQIFSAALLVLSIMSAVLLRRTPGRPG